MRASMEPPAAAAEQAEDDVSDSVVHDGEVILLKIRPSGWFVFLVSWPVIALCLGIALAAIVAVRGLHVDIPFRLAYVVPACMVAALLRIYLACLQWMKRVYILTNRRVIRLRGLLRTEVFDCKLRGIARAWMGQSLGERMLHTGSIFFEIPEMPAGSGTWQHVPSCADVEQILQEALSRCR